MRIQNIGENNLIRENLNFINSDTHYNYLKRSILKQQDVLITITGRVGTACVVDNDFKGNINQHIIRLSIIDTYDPYFISLYFNTNTGKILTNQFVTGGTRIALDYETLLKIKIPKISTVEQKAIVSFYFKIKKSLDYILSSIDEIKICIEPFLLEKIRISRKSKKKSDISFSSKDLLSRFDFLNTNYTKQNQLCFSFNKVKLRDIVYNYNKGNSPKPDEIQVEIEDEKSYYPMMRIQDISKENRLKFPIDTYVRKYIKGFNYAFLEKDDLIFVVTGATIGKVAYVKELHGKTMLGNDMMSVRFIQNTYNPSFIYYLFTTSYYQEELKILITGQTNGHLDPKDILSIEIPEIPILKQNKIVKEIKEKFIDKIEAKQFLIKKIKSRSNELIEELILGKKSIREAEKEINHIEKIF